MCKIAFDKTTEYFKVQWHDELPSTNDVLKQRAALGEAHGAVVVARSQTKGRGRYERTFYSPNKGLYFSVLLRPSDVPAGECGRYTAMGAVAVCRAMEALGFKPEIKWVNDVYLDGKKACGILAESTITEDGKIDYVVLGIGVNVTLPKGGFDESISATATSMYKRGGRRKVKTLLAKILDELASMLLERDEVALLEEYRARSFLIGRTVEVVEGRCQGIATVLGISEDYGLIVKRDGEVLILDGGEVKIKV